MKEVPWGTKIEPAEFVYVRAFMIMEHNYLCAVCREGKAVINTSTGILHPCWNCSKKYRLIKRHWLYDLVEWCLK